MQLGFVRVIHCSSTVALKAENSVVLKTRHGVPQDAHDWSDYRFLRRATPAES
jgi:hypothetical protein